MPLVRGAPIPPRRFGVVLADSRPRVVAHAETVLRTGVTLLGRQPIPAHRFLVIARHTSSREVLAREVELGGRIALLRPFAQLGETPLRTQGSDGRE